MLKDLFYKTRNITLAAYLITEGVRLEGHERKDDKVLFILQDPNGDVPGLEEVFTNAQAVVNLKDFLDNLNMLRDIVFQKGGD